MPSRLNIVMTDELAERYAATLAANLRQAMTQTGHSTRSLKVASGVSRSVILRILACDGLPRARVLGELETTLGIAIWPGPLPPEG